MRELWLNDQLCELDEKTKIALSKQVNTLNELQDRQSDFTNTFKLPSSGNNLRIVGFANRVSSDSINPYSKIPARYIENGSELVNGTAIVEGYDGTINVTLYSGNFNFFDLIEDKSLRDLDFSECDHVFNLDGVEDGSPGASYIYPLIQWGAIKNNTDNIDIRYQLPAIKFSLILDKIIEATGFNKYGGVFYSTHYQSLYLPIVSDTLFNEEDVLESYSFEAHKTNQVINPGSGAPIIIFNKYDTGDAFNSSLGWYNGWRWTAGNKTSGKIRVRLFMSTPYTPPGDGKVLDLVTVSLRINGVYKEIFKRKVFHGDPYNPLTTFIYEEDRDFKVGHYVEVYIQSAYSNTITILSDGTLFGSPDQYSYFSVIAKNTILLNQTIVINDLIPDIKQKDFIKDLFYLYGVIPSVDYFTKTASFIQFREIPGKREPMKKKTLRTKDWSLKLDLSSGYNISYRFGSYGQINYLNWAQDDDRDENIGRGIISINDNTLQKESDLLGTTLAASLPQPNFFGEVGVNIKRFTQFEADSYDNTITYHLSDKVLYNTFIYTAKGDTSGNLPTNGTYWNLDEYQFEQTESSSPRLVLLRPLGSSKTYTDGTTTRTISDPYIAYFQDPAQPFDLGFTYLVSENYKDLAHVLNKTKIVTAKFNLKESDVKNLDFFTPVWVGYFGDYFYINQVSNYINGSLTTCELVRL